MDAIVLMVVLAHRVIAKIANTKINPIL